MMTANTGEMLLKMATRDVLENAGTPDPQEIVDAERQNAGEQYAGPGNGWYLEPPNGDGFREGRREQQQGGEYHQAGGDLVGRIARPQLSKIRCSRHNLLVRRERTAFPANVVRPG